MTTTPSHPLAQTIHDLRGATEHALGRPTAEGFARLERFFDDVEAYVRESQQSMWSDEAKTAITNLQSGDPLTPEDLDVIRAFMISDAQAYLRRKNDFSQWVRELHRVIGDMETRANDLDRNAIADVRGLLKDAAHLISSIRAFCAEKQRVEKFENALLTLDRTARNRLAQVMADQLRSANR